MLAGPLCPLNSAQYKEKNAYLFSGGMGPGILHLRKLTQYEIYAFLHRSHTCKLYSDSYRIGTLIY